MLGELFIVFLKIGCVSFGGGYAVIPIIQYEALSRGWMTQGEFQQAVSLAGMAPGSIATNAATLLGYQSAGITGAIIATAGMVLPSLVLMIVVSAFILRLQNNKWLSASFYGLKPMITGLMVYAAIHFGYPNDGMLLSWPFAGMLLIVAGSLYLLMRYKLPPFIIIAGAGVVGIILF
ncbi:chromate transporter [Paenibacillus sp. KS-LC4]|uniref:chromate transporter n=1 Tax=Paenibacillus sp. KS-LC4 TaxID=2979727 RepID=UPI0030CEDA33